MRNEIEELAIQYMAGTAIAFVIAMIWGLPFTPLMLVSVAVCSVRAIQQLS